MTERYLQNKLPRGMNYWSCMYILRAVIPIMGVIHLEKVIKNFFPTFA